MIEVVQLKVSSPKVTLPGLDDALAKLGTLDKLLDKLSTRGPITLRGFDQAGQSIKGMTDYAKLLVDNLDRAGKTAAAGEMRAGFKSAEQELDRLNILAANLQRQLRTVPPGSAVLSNPAIANQVDALQSALASVNLRRGEIRSAQGDVGVRAQFDREAAALREAEQATTTVAGQSASALSAQGEVVLQKAGAMGKLTGALGTTAAAERQANAAMVEHGLLSERWIETEEGRHIAESRFRTGVGETQRVLGEEGKTIIEQTNYLEKFGHQFRQLDAEFAARKRGFAPGSPEHIQLLRDEAKATNDIVGQMKQVGLAEEAIAQRRGTRASALENRANVLSKRLDPRYSAIGPILEFEQRAPGFPGAPEISGRTTGAGRTETRTLRRENEGMREAITLTSQYDAQGRLLNATLAEQAKRIEANGRTTQVTLGGTVGMAAKFIAIYRGIDVGIRAFESGVQSTIEFERRLATLQIVFRGTKDEARELALGVLDQASAMGQDGVAALEVATDFARFGLNQAEVLEAVRVATMAANVAQLDLAQSGKYLQAIYAGYQLNVGQLAGVLGSLDTVSHSYNVTNQQLLEGLSRVAPLAKQAGISLNELIGYEAVISGRTARPGAESGTALKSLISRFAKPTTQGALQDIAGVDVLSAQTGELKSASQIINELFVSYQNLSRAEREELLIKVAGTQQASRIAALLDGYLKSQELAVKANLDLGRAERENILIRQTLSSQLGTLRTEWEKFWVASANPGLVGGAQNNLVEITKNLSNMLAILTAAENLAGRIGKRGGTGDQQGFAGGIGRSLRDAIGLTLPFSPGAAAGVGNRQFDDFKKFLKNSGLGDVFTSDADKATQSLIKFNAEIDKLEHAGEGQQAASRVFQTASKLIDSSTPEKLASILETVSHVAAPGDVRRQEQIRAELSTLARSNDLLELRARLMQLDAEANGKNATAIDQRNKKLTQQIDLQSKDRSNLESQRETAARGGRTGDVERLDALIEEKENQISALQRKLAGGVESQFPEGEEPYGYDADAKARGQTELQNRAKGIESIFQVLPKAGESKVGEIDRQIAEVQAKAIDVESRRVQLLQQTTEEQARARREIQEAAKEERGTLQTEDDRLQTLRQYATLQDSIIEGSRRGKIEIEQFKIGRNESEQLLREAGGIQGQLLPQASDRFRAAGIVGDTAGQAAAQGEVLELVNRLTTIQLSLDERRYRLAADIVNERRKENEEASKALQTATREDQLRAALIARFVQQRGGRGFSSNEFQFLDRSTQEAITKFNPNAAPSSLPTRSRELELEQAELTRAFGAITDSIKKTAARIEQTIGRNLITNPAGSGANQITVPGGIQPPPVQLQFASQFKEMIASLNDVVGSRLDAQVSDIQSQVREFINSNRINRAQSAASGAIG